MISACSNSTTSLFWLGILTLGKYHFDLVTFLLELFPFLPFYNFSCAVLTNTLFLFENRCLVKTLAGVNYVYLHHLNCKSTHKNVHIKKKSLDLSLLVKYKTRFNPDVLILNMHEIFAAWYSTTIHRSIQPPFSKMLKNTTILCNGRCL